MYQYITIQHKPCKKGSKVSLHPLQLTRNPLDRVLEPVHFVLLEGHVQHVGGGGLDDGALVGAQLAGQVERLVLCLELPAVLAEDLGLELGDDEAVRLLFEDELVEGLGFGQFDLDLSCAG